jgi:hypothetical protein
MKRTLLALLLTCVATTGCSRSAAPAPAKAETLPSDEDMFGQVARYQLLAAEHLVDEDKAGHNQKDLFRIDTITGKTWVYVTGNNVRGELKDIWSPIEQPPDAPKQ